MPLIFPYPLCRQCKSRCQIIKDKLLAMVIEKILGLKVLSERDIKCSLQIKRGKKKASCARCESCLTQTRRWLDQDSREKFRHTGGYTYTASVMYSVKSTLGRSRSPYIFPNYSSFSFICFGIFTTILSNPELASRVEKIYAKLWHDLKLQLIDTLYCRIYYLYTSIFIINRKFATTSLTINR